ncbi:MAG: aminotransferase class I/II-fold pyridoxal phosphate-dependent enzyme, partial [Bacteroidota bacterium]
MGVDTLVRRNILEMKPYSSARDEFEGQGEIFLDANENPFATGLNRYPDPYQRKLKAKIAQLKNVQVNQLFLGNGSDEAIDLILRIFCEPGQDEIITLDPTYGMYQVSAAIQNVAVKKVPLSTDFQLSSSAVLRAVGNKTKVIFICTPNNPSGNDLDPTEITEILSGFSGIVVIDEAYIDFTDVQSFT